MQESKVDLQELERYLKIYQENPDSRVFAPLADMYRRLGRYEQALEVCQDGLVRHPYYAGGKVALAHINLDQANYVKAIEEAENVVTYYPDNVAARKVLVKALYFSGDLAKAKRELLVLEELSFDSLDDPLFEDIKAGIVFSDKPVVRLKGEANEDNVSDSSESLPSLASDNVVQLRVVEGAESYKGVSPKAKRLKSLIMKQMFLRSLIRSLEQKPI